jgi:hypothetical protein
MFIDDDNDTLEEDFVVELDSDTDEEASDKAPDETQEAEEPDAKEKDKEDDAPAESEGASTQAVDEQELSDEDRTKLGNRAQKRIQRLVRQRKEVEEKNAALEARLEKLEHSNREFDVRNKRSQVSSLKQHASKLDAQEEQATQTWKLARESGDLDQEAAANNILATVKAEKLLVQRAVQQAELNEPAAAEEEGEERPQRQPAQPAVRPNKRAKEWQKKNLWFGGDTGKEKFMTQEALDIHADIMAEGINPNDDPEEYYAELSQRLAVEFPDEFKTSKEGKRSPVSGGGTRSTNSNGKKVIRLSKSEIATAKRLGVTPEAYARGKAKQLQART